jgi:predicted regulator of Ras-like GTPase activity (Roadblock/LC7/MglB family)
MPYQRILDELVRSVPGAQGALLLDSEGEVVVQAGARDYRHKLIGAYQGIALAVASRIGRRHGAGPVRSLTCRYTQAALVLRPLKDGYYFVLSLGPDAAVAEAERLSDFARGRMDEAL